MSIRPARADVWWTDFGSPIGSEQASGQRPSVVISGDDLHGSEAPFAFVVPVTTTQRHYLSRVRIAPGRSGLRLSSWAAVEHTRSISTIRLLEHLGSVSESVMDQILGALHWLLDLDP
ncbi:MAG: type II toxin-antitoxin system PemK/MazF family toxin [Candidatus Dormibacteraceae bacterium]